MRLKLKSLWTQFADRVAPTRVKTRSILLRVIQDIIAKEGPISLERYMEIVLQHPQHGYYRQGNPIGSDFETAPEISQMFGEMLGLWCFQSWQDMGKPDPFVVLELGPGRGTLMYDLLRFMEPAPDFRDALRLRFLESNATLRALQQEKLCAYSPIHLDDLSQMEALPTIVIANEFFDNMPVRQFVKTQSGWRERLVDCQNGQLVLAEGKEKTSLPPEFETQEFDHKEPGWIYEVSSQTNHIMRQLVSHVARHNGAGIVIDYGPDAPCGKETLDAWSQQKPTHILAEPGKVDVTADVDFSSLRRIAESQGLATGLVGQGAFLQTQGIMQRSAALCSHAPEAQEKINRDLYHLLSPSKMGVLWKTLTFRPQNRE